MSDADILRLIASLIFIVLLILGGAWATRRAGWLRSSQGQAIKVVGSQRLGAHSYISIVEVEGARLVVGIAGNQITLLHTMPPSAHSDAVVELADPVGPVSFASAFTQVLSRRHG